MENAEASGGSEETTETRVDLEDLVAGLSEPRVFGVRDPVRVVHTHASVVFLAGKRAYKVKKPLRLWGLLDYGTFAARKACCEEEVRLNRRLAAEIYLGVVRIVLRPDGTLALGGSGEVVEHAVAMVRLPPGATLEERLRSQSLQAEELHRVAATLAAFHRAHRLAPERTRHALPSGFAWVVRQNHRATRAQVPALFPARVHEGTARRMARRLWRARGTIRRRVAEGRMVDGHGDLRLEHVLRYRGRICVIDGVEFSPRLRHVDPLSDLAFLVMDLVVRGREDLAGALLGAYLEATQEPLPDVDELLPLYLHYRAHVRAKVDAQASSSPGLGEEERAAKARSAARHLALAWTYGREGRTGPLVVMRGPSGSGKSVLASALAPWLRAEVVQSDLVRKELAGLAATDRPTGEARERLYSHEMSERTYATLLERGLRAVRRGRAAILDATYLWAESRAEVREAARRAGAPFAILDVSCPEEEIRERLRRRAEEDEDASDADFAVYESQVRAQQPLTSEEEARAVSHRAGRPAEDVVLSLLERLETDEGEAA